MVGSISEAKSSVSGVTNPYCRTEHCGKIHPYRCDKEVGVLGVVEGWKKGDIVGLGVHAVMRMIVMLLQL